MKQRKELLDKIKKKLLQRKAELLKSIEDSDQDKVSDQQVMDTGDEALSLSLEKLKNSLQATEIDELNLIDQALEHIESGEYGICIDCGKNISDPRLNNYPYAARCIVCQEAIESR